ncbi:kinesin, putative [Cryptococcus deneoformans JEC21]|uniref:Kinesin-like protein n=1 Tax=Cryptococcus deneoformans (strain JEC21 / ATCC MYA-565) TaxID=214684 RepID=Q5KFC1_CRYD1|nr:kinesin, putative [Cryptococcus neoformans var. neoformans JEC21]AAW44238.2 kinesin, putative [Cryptococcus neoformans var. neoformans JEC21]
MEQENNPPPLSRLPRLASPIKPSSIPVPSAASSIPHMPPLTSDNNANTGISKRKMPSSPMHPPVAKRSVSGGAPPISASALGKSTMGAAASAGLRTSQRKNTSGGFVPKPKALATRPGTSLGVSTRRTAGSAGSTTSASSSEASVRPTATRSRSGLAPPARPPTAAGTSRTGTMTRAGSALGRSAGPTTRLGARVPAVSGAVKDHDGRLENVEMMLGNFHHLFEAEQAKISTLQSSQESLQALLQSTQTTERAARLDLTSASEEIAALRSSHAREVDELERTIARKEREKINLEDELRDGRDELSRERDTVRALKVQLAEQSTKHLTLEAQLSASQTQLTNLQSEVERATLAVSAMKAELQVGQDRARDAEMKAEKKVREAEEERDRRIAEIEEELRTAETIRRKLHNQVQELKGNIRVFARVRPVLPHELSNPEGVADIAYGDERTAQETGQSQIVVTSRSESAMGKEREQINQFTFDKIFAPQAGQKEVFEEISMLAQSVLDGYNVCIFAYGQTGSGKSWTMEGAQDEENAGLIPRAIDMIFKVSGQLKDRGWKYQMEGQFLEVYNEVINDLLGNGQFDTKRHEIKLDKDGKISVTEAVSVPLSNPKQVHTLLERAQSRRAVAATLMNERSSRSHSVFTLKVKGVNPLTDEKCEAMLNLVDLAGSERIEKSGAGENKDRLKEAININKSLSALADVIGALGQGQQGGHVPYRNSTLTRLLQTSLSGSSKTLMLCNLSPLATHLGETLCSLRFATKVNTTQVGQAKKAISR